MADTSETKDLSVIQKRPGFDKIRLQKMRVKLVDDLTIVEGNKLLDLLYSEQIFDREEINQVFPEVVPETKMRKLLDILEKKVDIPRDPPVLDIVANFLIETCGREELAKEMIEIDGFQSPLCQTSNLNDKKLQANNSSSRLQTSDSSNNQQLTTNSSPPAKIPTILKNLPLECESNKNSVQIPTLLKTSGDAKKQKPKPSKRENN